MAKAVKTEGFFHFSADHSVIRIILHYFDFFE